MNKKILQTILTNKKKLNYKIKKKKYQDQKKKKIN